MKSYVVLDVMSALSDTESEAPTEAREAKVPGHSQDKPKPGSGTRPMAATFDSISKLDSFDFTVERIGLSNSVASEAAITSVLSQLLALEDTAGNKIVLNTGPGARALIQAIIRVMADVGTSRYTNYNVSFNDTELFVQHGVLHMDTVATVIKRHCTLRQFAAYYAPLYWNWAHKMNQPPANWVRKGGTEDTKYTCFDFFFGLTHSASIGGTEKDLDPKPTPKELSAAQTNTRINVVRAAMEASPLVTTYMEATRGRVESGPTVNTIMPSSGD